MVGVDKGTQDFNTFETDIRFYHTFQFPGRLIFALRAGGGINTGKYEFYQAQILDGKTELRGFRKTRFYGDSKFYTNMEVRLKLASFRTYLFPVSFGILGFHDIGRVWYKDENGIDPTASEGKSNVWHTSWGGGLWFTPFNMAVLSTELGHSKEGNLFYVRLGFLF
jgi:outer membrane protein assembly factor BamA